MNISITKNHISKLNSYPHLLINDDLPNSKERNSHSKPKPSSSEPQYHLHSFTLPSFIESINITNIYNVMKSTNNNLFILQSLKHCLFDIPYLSSRQFILDKISLTISKLKFSKNTYYLTVYFYDYIMSLYLEGINDKVKPTLDKCIYKGDQIGMGCLFLAAKYCEIDPQVPTLKEIQNVFIPSMFYSNLKLRKIEMFCLQKLNYILHVYTPFDYIDLYIKNGIYNNNINLCKTTYSLLDTIIKHSPLYLQFQSHKLALSIIQAINEKHYKQLTTCTNFNSSNILITIINEINSDINITDEYTFVSQCLNRHNNNPHSTKNYNSSGKKVQFKMNQSSINITRTNHSSNKDNKTCNSQIQLSSSSKHILSKSQKKSSNRSSNASTSSGEISYNLQKIKEQSKLIKTNIYSLNSNLLDRESSGNKTNNSINQYKSGTYKLRLNLLKLNLNNTISQNNKNKLNQNKALINNNNSNNNNGILFKKESYTKRESNDFGHNHLNTSGNKILSRCNNIKRNILNKNTNNNNTMMLSFEKSRNSFLDIMNSSRMGANCNLYNNKNNNCGNNNNNSVHYHRINQKKILSSSMMGGNKFDTEMMKGKIIKEKGVFGQNK